MIIIKTPAEIAKMRVGGKKLAKVLNQVAQAVKPGVTTAELDQLAEKLIRQEGGRPSFKNYQGVDDRTPFPSALCASINNEIVHAPAQPSRILKNGDIIGLDLGLQYDGYFTDMAVTVPVGKVSRAAQRLIKATKTALDLAIQEVKPGNTLGDIGAVIQAHAEKNNLAVVRDLTGHGVGQRVHEPPAVLNYGQPGKGIKLEPGMTLALEPMFNVGSPDIKVLEDSWTITTIDGQLSAHFEKTIAVTDDGCEILTK